MLYKKIREMYRQMLYKRCDSDGSIFYFTHRDFPGLQQEAFPFSSADGHMLQGYLYHYENPIPGRLVMFEHGMGSGHTGYMQEIQLLAKQGYLVFAYDHTGCMASGGAETGGFPQSLKDLNDALTALKADKRFAGFRFSVVGHSWGGYSTLNIQTLHPDVSHVVAISGFLSVEQIIKDSFSGLLAFAGKRLWQEELEKQPQWTRFHALETLKNGSAKGLIIHSDDDKTVACKSTFDVLQEALQQKENLRFLRLTGKNHNPNYTADAVRYKDDFFRQYQKQQKKGLLKTQEQKDAFIAAFDWQRMTTQDEAVWAEIFRTLES